MTKNHPEFICKQNKSITYENGVCCCGSWEGATKMEIPSHIICNSIMYETYHPYGHILIALEDDPEIKKLEKLKKKILKEEIQKKKNEINAITDEKVLNDKYMFFSPSFNT